MCAFAAVYPMLSSTAVHLVATPQYPPVPPKMKGSLDSDGNGARSKASISPHLRSSPALLILAPGSPQVRTTSTAPSQVTNRTPPVRPQDDHQGSFDQAVNSTRTLLPPLTPP
jgi:hypothetical protein